jgi:hypothetical protein
MQTAAIERKRFRNSIGLAAFLGAPYNECTWIRLGDLHVD